VVKVKGISNNCVKLIMHFECMGDMKNYLKAYKDSANIWTIGAGTTIYPDGYRVKEGDVISPDEANDYLTHDLRHAIDTVDALTTDALEQHQFDALVSFVYNLGAGNYRVSTLRKLVNESPKNYKAIIPEFLKWDYSNHKELSGLTRRRKAEAYMYVYGETKFYFTNNDNIV
jgi:lysozyme